jgi:hypothetical protein
MRTNLFVAFGISAVAIGAAVLVACSSGDKPSCRPGTLALIVELDGTANFADTVTITADDPSIGLAMPVMHVPNGPYIFTVDVAFPNGYPANRLVHFIARASGAGTLLGENEATIHLDDVCSTGGISIRSETLDATVWGD